MAVYLDDPQAQRANRKYVRASMQMPLLPREDEFSLARRWRAEQDVSALHEFVHAHTRIVISIAARLRNYGLTMGDLVRAAPLIIPTLERISMIVRRAGGIK